MTKLPLCEYPNPILHQKAQTVVDFNDDLRRLTEDMLETMYADKGVGLAGPQIGVSQRIIVVDTQQHEEDGVYVAGQPMALINPEIIRHSEDKIVFCEGCLSIPGQSADVERFRAVRIRYQDVTGKSFEFDAEDYPAVVFQHEIDHLSGILYIDRISRLKRNMLLKKLEKFRASREGE